MIPAKSYKNPARGRGREASATGGKRLGASASRGTLARGDRRCKSSYDAAGFGPRMGNWWPDREGINSILIREGGLITSRARDLLRQSPIATNGVREIAKSVVGTVGMTPRSLHPDEGVRRKIQEEWKFWCDQIDFTGRHDFVGLQNLMISAMVGDGEAFAWIKGRPLELGLRVPLQVQVVESDYLPMFKNETLSEGSRIVAGVELKEDGSRDKYHFSQAHPGENDYAFRGLSTIEIPERDIVHMYRVDRPGQLRGVSWFTTILALLYMTDLVNDAEVAAYRVGALYAAFVKQSETFLSDMERAKASHQGLAPIDLVPGQITYLRPGQEVIFSKPGREGIDYVEFMRHQLHLAAMGLGVPYEILTGNYEKVNFASAKAGRINYKLTVSSIQSQHLKFTFCNNVWKRWMDMAVLVGVLPFRDYYANRAQYQNVLWQPPGWESLEPLRDMQEHVAGLENKIFELQDVIRWHGGDPDERMGEVDAGGVA